MTPRSRPRLSARIGLLFIAVLVSMSLFFVCTSTGSAPVTEPDVVSPTPPPASYTVVLDALDPPLAPVVRTAAERAAAGLGGAAVFGSTSGANVTVSHFSGIASIDAAIVRYWGVFTGFWSEAEAFDLGLVTAVYLPLEHETALRRLIAPIAGSPKATWLPEDEIGARIAAEADAAGFLPIELAGPGLRSLSYQGSDPFRGIGSFAGSPLAERIYLAWQDEISAAFGRALAAELTIPPPRVTRIAFTGDIIPARCVYERQRDLDDYTAAFRDTADYLRTADLTVGSLDASVSDAGTPVACERTFNLIAPARSVEGFVFAGFDVITVATNHAKDCGSLGIGCNDASFRDTLTNLEAAGIAPAGGGLNYAEAHQPAVLTANGIRFAFLGYDDVASTALAATDTRPGTAALDPETLAADIAAAKAQADVVIVLPQWGVEYTSTPTGRQIEIGRDAIAAGATLVVGNHPHTVQAVEWSGEGFIAYALGNFVFDQDWALETQQSAVLEATFVGTHLVSIRLLPVRIVEMFRPTWASATESRQIIERIRVASDALPSP